MTDSAESTVTWDDWPVVQVVGSGADQAGHHAVVTDVLRQSFDRGGRFAVVVVQPAAPDAPDEPDGGLAADRARGSGVVDGGRRRVPKTGIVRFLKANRRQMGEHCAGLAVVAPPSTLARAGRLLPVASRILGCPVHATSDPEAARRWAYGQLGRPVPETGPGS